MVGSAAGTTGFAESCREVGTALARAGFELVVGSDSDGTADLHVAEGAELEKAPILYIGPSLARSAWRQAFNTSAEWVERRIAQLSASDAMLVLGGGPRTEQVYEVASGRGQPIVSLLALGGVGEDSGPSGGPHAACAKTAENAQLFTALKWAIALHL